MFIFHSCHCLTLLRVMWTTFVIWTGSALHIVRCLTSLQRCCRKLSPASLFRCPVSMKKFAAKLSAGPVADYGGRFSIGQCESVENTRMKLPGEKRPLIRSGNWPTILYFPGYARDLAVAVGLISLGAHLWEKTWQSGSVRLEFPSWKVTG